jgi:CBS domain-containing membrane protein
MAQNLRHQIYETNNMHTSCRAPAVAGIMRYILVMSQLLVRDLMSQPVKTVGPTSPLRDVIHLMEVHGIRHVPVVEDETGHLLGLISNRDVLRSQEGSLSGTASDEQMQMNRWIEARWVMTKDVRTVYPDTPALDAARILRSHGYGCVPVVERGKLVGMVTEADFVDYAIKTMSDPGA